MIDTTEVTTTTDAPKQTKAVKTSSLHVTFAKAKGIDVTRAAKLNRSYIRANFDVIAKQWPALRASQKQNRDSNRYPDTIPAGLAKQIVTRSVKGAKR
jgi:hypothetical protein